ncbi:phosphate transporter pho1-like 10 [Gossypium australe]|uniref:Phosphate transporter pho1-like 10 n=1 Tax=Gossypium australe TaxID=47621 RepID=A0A5B6U5F2_9ROSI|nr:phosphate transporter pho1-like 10 [Gossypium australe]
MKFPSISLMKEQNFSCHPMANLVMGLTFCQLWYSNLTEEVKLRKGNYVAYTHDAVSSQCGSETSVLNDKRESPVAGSNQQRDIHVQNNVNLQRAASLVQEIEPLGSNQNSAENEVGFYDDSGYTCDPSVFSALESWLMPLKLPYSSENFVYLHRQMVNNHYKDALKHLRLALHCEPPLFAALLPLIQLLLIGGQAKEALSEVEKFCNMSNMPFPFRY